MQLVCLTVRVEREVACKWYAHDTTDVEGMFLFLTLALFYIFSSAWSSQTTISCRTPQGAHLSGKKGSKRLRKREFHPRPSTTPRGSIPGLRQPANENFTTHSSTTPGGLLVYVHTYRVYTGQATKRFPPVPPTNVESQAKTPKEITK